ncbi:MAG: hydantoinase B/oxoprolinase family protein [Rhodospirillales bacterium]|nr:hydantoinase B/oxoprolinase family protein [Rhodospirillales bacterium]
MNAVTKPRVDPVTLEILRNALTAIAECDTSRMIRASTSIIVNEMEDCSAAMFDATGRLLSESATIPIHLNCTGVCLPTILEDYIPAAEWTPGDIVVTNDPYAGNGSMSTAHTNDYVVFMRAFFEDRLVGFTGLMVHHLEIGAMHMVTRGWNVEIYQEGRPGGAARPADEAGREQRPGSAADAGDPQQHPLAGKHGERPARPGRLGACGGGGTAGAVRPLRRRDAAGMLRRADRLFRAPHPRRERRHPRWHLPA